jgi:hypothetical protein
VTADDYSKAIIAMRRDPRYKRATNPTSFEKYALGIADKRKNPARLSNDKDVRKDAAKLDPAVYKGGWGR